MLNFSFIPHTASEKKIFEYFFFRKFTLYVAIATKRFETNKRMIFTKVALNMKDYSINIYLKTKFKYPQPDNGKCQYPLFLHISHGNFKLP